MLLVLHVAAAVMATFRLTELVTMDNITNPLRARLAWYVLTCSRCVSVWAAAVAVAGYLLWPWINWPFAFAWLYLVAVEGRFAQMAKPARLAHAARDADAWRALRHSDTAPPLTVALVRFNLGGPEYVTSANDREMYSRVGDGRVDENLIRPSITRLVMLNAIQTAFARGMDRDHGRVWAAWQDVIIAQESECVVPRSMVRWLWDILKRDDLPMPPGLALWRESLRDYLAHGHERAEAVSPNGLWRGAVGYAARG